ncbi:MAG: hypothetical protein IBX64_13260 [Actinobacteria bacterium]|nr:hypothetical protein [Actinomycetota bacterium]
MIWPPSSEAPKFTDIDSANWMTLERCSKCGQLWAGVPYEPYASFMYYVAWPQEEREWKTQIQKDEGAALHSWHKSQLKTYSSTLTSQDLKAIEAHRERSYGRDPYSEA